MKAAPSVSCMQADTSCSLATCCCSRRTPCSHGRAPSCAIEGARRLIARVLRQALDGLCKNLGIELAGALNGARGCSHPFKRGVLRPRQDVAKEQDVSASMQDMLGAAFIQSMYCGRARAALRRVTIKVCHLAELCTAASCVDGTPARRCSKLKTWGLACPVRHDLVGGPNYNLPGCSLSVACTTDARSRCGPHCHEGLDRLLPPPCNTSGFRLACYRRCSPGYKGFLRARHHPVCKHMLGLAVISNCKMKASLRKVSCASGNAGVVRVHLTCQEPVFSIPQAIATISSSSFPSEDNDRGSWVLWGRRRAAAQACSACTSARCASRPDACWALATARMTSP